MKKFLLLFILCYVIKVEAQIPTNGLTGYWPFSSTERANDYSGNNNNGTIHGATLTTDRFGNCNQAYQFNGINNYIEVLSSPTVDMNNIDFTLACWIKTFKTDTHGYVLNKCLHTGVWNGYALVTNGDDQGYCPAYKHAYFYAAAGAYQEACSNNPVCQDTTWHFITGVFKYNTNKTYFYVDGVLQSGIGQSSGQMTNNTSLFFGGNGDINANYFTGVIDAIRIYQRALTAAEILQLYNEPNPDSTTGTSIVKDTSACTSSPVLLNIGNALSYTWSTGSNAQTISVNNSGTYWVQTLVSNGCNVTDTIHVHITNPITTNFLKDTSVCANINYTLSAAQANATSYTWSTGVTGSSIIPSTAGIYWVKMQIGSCLVKDSAQINFISSPTFSLVKDTVICNEPIVLSINDTSLSANWSNGSHANQTLINSAGIYSVSVSNRAGCITNATVNIKNKEMVSAVIVPNIFTPNGDNHNDVFEFNTNGYVVNEFNIYDRWGKLVYSAKNVPVNWDGKQTDDGTYYWTAVFASACNNNSETLKQKGFLTVLK